MRRALVAWVLVASCSFAAEDCIEDGEDRCEAPAPDAAAGAGDGAGTGADGTTGGVADARAADAGPAPIDAPPPDAACVPAGESCDNGSDDDCDELVDCQDPDCAAADPRCCSGTGLVHVIRDQCLDDGGSNAAGDSMQVYCCDSITRMCLSGESCPWRAGCVSTTATCSRSGLSSDYMGRSTGCDQWRGKTNYYCSPDSILYFP